MVLQLKLNGDEGIASGQPCLLKLFNTLWNTVQWTTVLRHALHTPYSYFSYASPLLMPLPFEMLSHFLVQRLFSCDAV